MFRIRVRESAGAAKAYYTEKARQDYYSEGQEIVGNWGGKGAERLGLKGKVETEAFENLCDNINPATGKHLTARIRRDRIPGYDLNFHCPKSVSVVYAWNNDRRIVEAFLRAVRETMTEVEMSALTRIRKGGQADGNRKTGELTWAEFVHLTARPEGRFPDPHLHAHLFTFNATFDPVEQKWKALHFREIFDNAPYYQAAFLTRLANNLMAIGYDVRPVAKAFEIMGVPDEVILQFSKRTVKIKETAAKLGISDPRILDKLGALTRKAKKSDLTFSELRQLWRSEIIEAHRVVMDRFLRPRPSSHLGQHPLMAPEATFAPQPPGKRKPTPESALALLGPSGKAPPYPRVPVDPSLERKALDQSIKHNFYRASVVTEAEILAQAMRLGYGSGLTPEGLREAMKRHPEFIFGEIKGRRFVTTHAVLAEEKKNIAWVKAGMGTLQPLIPNYRIQDTTLNEEQQAAVLHVLNSRDRVTAIEGKSGTGKTWLMREAVRAIEELQVPVLVMAPSTRAVQETLKNSGFVNAQTVEQLLVNKKLQEEHRNGVWWVDEGGMLSGRSMAELFELARNLGSRIVFSGDVGQHRAVERGDALRMLYEYSDLKPAVVSKIMRQKGDYKEWMELLAKGHVVDAFRKMDAAGVIEEIPESIRYEEIAKRYLKRMREGHLTGVIAPTHLEGKMVTDAIRAERKALGELKVDTPILQLKPVDMSPADIIDWRSYKPGWVVEFFQSMPTSATGPTTEAGTRQVIDHIDYEQGAIYVKARDAAGREATRLLDLEKCAEHFAVYEPGELNIAPGDRILITKNCPTECGPSKIFRGSEHTVEGFDEHGDLKLQNGQVLKRDFAHLTYGYYSTSIGAQSKNLDYVIVAESAVSFPAGSRQQIYVSVGRGKIGLEIITNDKQGLLEAVMASSQRYSAMELIASSPDLKVLPETDHEKSQTADEKPEPVTPKRHLGQHRVEPPRQPEPELPCKPAKPLKWNLGKGLEMPEQGTAAWSFSAVASKGNAEPLKTQLGTQQEAPRKSEWTFPAVTPKEPEKQEPDVDEGMTPPMMP